MTYSKSADHQRGAQFPNEVYAATPTPKFFIDDAPHGVTSLDGIWEGDLARRRLSVYLPDGVELIRKPYACLSKFPFEKREEERIANNVWSDVCAESESVRLLRRFFKNKSVFLKYG